MTKKSIDRRAKDLGRKRIQPTKDQMAALRAVTRDADRTALAGNEGSKPPPTPEQVAAYEARAKSYEKNREVIEAKGWELESQFRDGTLRPGIPDQDIVSGVSAFAADGLGPWGFRHDKYCASCGALQSCCWSWREIIDVLSGKAKAFVKTAGTCGHDFDFGCNVGRDEVLLAIQKGWTTVEEHGEKVDLSNDLLAALVVK